MPVFKVICDRARNNGTAGPFMRIEVEIAAPDAQKALEEFSIMYEPDPLRATVSAKVIPRTLAQWAHKWDRLPTAPTTERGAVSVIPPADWFIEAARELYGLDDYTVSSVSGVVTWLVPVSSEAAPKLGGGAERGVRGIPQLRTAGRRDALPAGRGSGDGPGARVRRGLHPRRARVAREADRGRTGAGQDAQREPGQEPDRVHHPQGPHVHRLAARDTTHLPGVTMDRKIPKRGRRTWFFVNWFSGRGLRFFGTGAELAWQWAHTQAHCDATISLVLGQWVEDHRDQMIAHGNSAAKVDTLIAFLSEKAADPSRNEN